MALPVDKSADQLRARLTRLAARDPSDSIAATGEKLKNLLSTTPQLRSFRDAYGADWSERFVPVETFRRDIQLFGHQGVKLVELLWNHLTAFKFKRFQEAFSEKEDYYIPRPNLTAPGVQYPPRAELARTSLVGCLVSPARIPFKLLVDLGIVSEPRRSLTDIEALEIKSQPYVIATLKAVWEAAEPLAHHNHRYLVVRQVDTSAYPEARKIPEDTLGCLLNFRENTSVPRTGTKRDRSKWHAPKQIPSFYPSIYTALRSTDHEFKSYALDTISIEQLSQEWNDLTQRARQNWLREAPADIKASLREEFVRLVAKSRQELKGVSNELKRKAANSFTALEGELQNGSNNVRAFATTVEAAVRKLQKCLDQGDRKKGYNTVDQSVLDRTIQRAQQNFTLVSNSLFVASSRLAGEMSTKKGAYFHQTELSPTERKAEAGNLITRLNIPIHTLEGIHQQPLKLFAERIRAAYAELQEAVLRQDAPAAKHALVKIVAISKIQRAHDVFEELRRYAAKGEVIPLRELARSATSLKSIIERRSVFIDTVVAEYKIPYELLEKRVKLLAKGLERHCKKGLDLSQRADMYSKLRIFLDETDLAAIIRALPTTSKVGR